LDTRNLEKKGDIVTKAIRQTWGVINHGTETVVDEKIGGSTDENWGVCPMFMMFSGRGKLISKRG